MHRFFTQNSLQSEIFLIASENPLFHQIGHVFRSKIGQRVIFFEKNGTDIVYEVSEVSRHSITFKKIEVLSKKLNPQGKSITLFQSYPNKLSTLELLVQKIVEIGAKRLVLFPSEYSQMKSLSPAKMMRLSLIAQEAMEQSGGNCPLIIDEEKDLETGIKKYPPLYHIIAHQKGSKKIPESKGLEIGLWVGPEGGWSIKEEDFFKKNGFTRWSFNENILRLETAGILGTGILAYSGPL